MKAQCLLTLLMVCGAWKNAEAVISCYECQSTIGPDGVEVNVPTTDAGSCVSLTGKTVVASTNDFGCQTLFQTSGGSTTIIRSALAVATTTPGCTSNAGSTTCTCTTDKCNSNAMTASQSYSCYVCDSSLYFDNGCGEKLNAGSAFVRQVKGCSACYKTAVTSQDRSVLYSRGCTRAVDIDDSCSGDEGSMTGRTCGCKGALCNSADTVALKSATVFSALVLSVIVRLMC